ncbi:glycoside hydrolase family 3 C-terminal domain-containing protein [Salinifilum aidingensis]
MTTTAQRDAPDDASLHALLSELSVVEKAALVAGGGFWTTAPLPKIGLSELVLSDGPNGVRGPRWDERDPSALIPVGAAIGASWDRDVARTAGSVLGAEARRRGVHAVLAPTVNLHRSPYGGRNFENLAEDPLLVAELGAEIAAGLQGHGVAAAPKHFAANDTESGRNSYDVVVDADTLRDVHLKPFRRIVRRAGPWMLMAAYNSVNGRTMTENRTLISDVLKSEWDWDGVLVSDWFATSSVDASALAGLDLTMPGTGSPWAGGELAQAVKKGRVPEDVLDDKVLRLLRLAWRTGALDVTAKAAPPAAAAGPEPAETAETIRDMAARTFVLLRNDPVDDGSPLLPLPRGTRTIAVLGENAFAPVVQGGGSSQVVPAHVVGPVDGLREAFPDATVVAQRGVRHQRLLEPLAPEAVLAPPDAGEGGERSRGVLVEYLDARENVLSSEIRGVQRLLWTGREGMPAGTRRLRLSTNVRAEAGENLFGVSGTGRAALRIAGRELFDEHVTREGDTADPAVELVAPPERRVAAVLLDTDFAADGTVSLAVDFEPADLDGIASVGVGWRPQQWDEQRELTAAVEAARDADAAVVVVGTSSEVETEGSDRSDLSLPGGQDELVRRVAEVNPRTVAVVNAGAPVLLPWAGSVPAVLWTWFGSQEFGGALADVLAGKREPSGRMPTTVPAELADVPVPLPAIQPQDGHLRYEEGDAFGYRAYARSGTMPAFHFGEGLGYTEWDYEEAVDDGDSVRVRIRNVGPRAGSEVVQLYATAEDRPPRLVGFAKVHVERGAEVEVLVELDELDEGEHGLAAGRSVGDLRLTVR